MIIYQVGEAYLFMENLNVHWFIKWKDIEIT